VTYIIHVPEPCASAECDCRLLDGKEIESLDDAPYPLFHEDCGCYLTEKVESELT